MAYTCPECGHKDKPSQDKYYKKTNTIRPNCRLCNPTFKQKTRKRWNHFLVSAFSSMPMGYTPLASLPYIPVVILLAVAAMFIAPNDVAYFVGFICIILSYLCNVRIAQKVADVLRYRLLRGLRIRWIIVIYYTPLFALILSAVVGWLAIGVDKS